MAKAQAELVGRFTRTARGHDLTTEPGPRGQPPENPNLKGLEKRPFGSPKSATAAMTAEPAPTIPLETAPTAGRLDVRLYSPSAPRSPSASAARRLLLAAGHRSVRAGQITTLRLKLTAAGRRAIRRAKRRAKPLKLAVIATFAPSAGDAITVTKALTIRSGRSPRRGAASATAASRRWRLAP